MEQSATHEASPSETPIPLTPSPKRSLLPILGIVLLIFLVGSGGYFLGQRSNKTRSKQINEKITLAPTAIPSPIVTLTPTLTDQNKFFSQRCGFSVKELAGWTSKEEDLVPGNNNPNFHYLCVSNQAPDYKMTGVREGLFVYITRTKKGATFKNVVINTLDDYIKADEAIWEPAPTHMTAPDKTIGDKVGKIYNVKGMEEITNFIFLHGDYIYDASWPANYTGQYLNDVEPLISSITF